MVKLISLDEIALQEGISEPKKMFLNECRLKINEATCIFAETNPLFKRELSQGESQFKIFVESSRDYDAEISAGPWCYIDFVATRDDAKERISVIRANREEFSFNYKGQSFLVKYGKILKPKRK